MHTSILSIGSTAPCVTLKQKTAQGLKDVRLSDFFGKKPVVLLFFPLAFTSVCTDEMCKVTEDIQAYQSLNAQVFAISVDSPFAQEAWAKQNHIQIDLLSDFNREAIGLYGVVCNELVGLKQVAKRSAFVIDLDGKISLAWSSDDPKVLPDFAAIQAHLN